MENTNLLRAFCFSSTDMGVIVGKYDLIVKGISTGPTYFFFSSFCGAAEELSDADDAVSEAEEDDEAFSELGVSESRGGTLSADSVFVSSDDEDPPKNPLSLPAKANQHK